MNILIVEDDRKIANYSREGFEEEGFAVDLASDGEGGLALLERKSYDAIILDWMLPGIDGIEVCRQIRASGSTVPVIMLTARVFIEDRVVGLNSGADDYLPKPFYFEELLARVKALIRRASYASDPLIHVGDLTINLHRREVTRAGKAIKLTPKEYEILELLIINRGKTLTGKAIVRSIWGNNGSINSNILNVYMHRLRDKIDNGHSQTLITTIRRHGFKIDA